MAATNASLEAWVAALSSEHSQTILHALQDLRNFISDSQNRHLLTRLWEKIFPPLERILQFRDRFLVEQAACLAGELAALTQGGTSKIIQHLIYRLGGRRTKKEAIVQGLCRYLELSTEGNVLVDEIVKQLIITIDQTGVEITLLDSVVNGLELAATLHGSVFRSHFIDTVDVLVGWYLRPHSPSSSLKQRLDNAFCSFNLHWISSRDFATTLLSRFLGDMEKLLEETNGTSLQRAQQLTNYVQCYSSVVSSLASFYSACSPFLTKTLFHIFDKAAYRFHDVSFLWTAILNCTDNIITMLETDIQNNLDDILSFCSTLASLTVPAIGFSWIALIERVACFALNSSTDDLESLISSILIPLNKYASKHIVEDPAKFNSLFNRLLLESGPSIAKETIKQLFTFIPSKDAVGIANRRSVLFSLVMIINCFNSKSATGSVKWTVCEFLFLYPEAWGKLAYFSTELMSMLISAIQSVIENALPSDRMLSPLFISKCLTRVLEKGDGSIAIPTLEWLSNLAQHRFLQLSSSLSSILVILAKSRDARVRKASVDCIGHIIASNGITSWQKGLHVTVNSIEDNQEQVWFAALKAVGLVAPFIASNNAQYSTTVDSPLPSSVDDPPFGGLQFKEFISHLRTDSFGLKDFLSRLFLSSHTEWHGDKHSLLNQQESSYTAERWAVSCAASYCVQARLRSTLGNALQTFEGLEAILSRFGRIVQEERVSGETRRQVRVFVWFILELEKQVHRAIDHVIPGLSQQTVVFFATNQKTCEDWFVRLRPLSLRASLLAAPSEPDLLLRCCYLRLGDLRTLSLRSDMREAFQEVLLRACSVLCDMGDADAIQGLISWGRSFTAYLSQKGSISFETIGTIAKGIWLQCIESYQEALKTLTSILSQDVLSTLNRETISIILHHCSQLYAAAQEWDTMDTWMPRLHDIQQRYIGKLGAGEPSMLPDILLKNLACIDRGEKLHGAHVWEVDSAWKDGVVAGWERLIGGETQEAIRTVHCSTTSLRSTKLSQSLPLLAHLYSSVGRHGTKIPSQSALRNSDSFLRQTEWVHRSQNEHTKADEILLRRCKIARKNHNIDHASSLLSRFRFPFTSKDEYVLESQQIRIASNEDEESAVDQLISLSSEEDTNRSVAAKALLTVSNWLDSNHERGTEYVALLLKEKGIFSWTDESKLRRTTVCGKLLEKAVEMVGTESTNYLVQYGNWCTIHGRQNLLTRAKEYKLEKDFLPEEIREYREVINDTFSRLWQSYFEDRDSMTFTRVKASLGEELSKLVDPQRQEELTEILFNKWFTIAKSMLSMQREAVRMYLRALDMGTATKETPKQRATQVSCALHVLQLMVKYGGDVCEDEQCGTSVDGWQDIIPQLLAHLGNSDDKLVSRLLAILGRLAHSVPHRLVYPVTIGSQMSTRIGKGYQELFQLLRNNDCGLMEGVDTMVTELLRITDLWEEVWSNQLAALQVPLHRQVTAYKNASSRIKNTTPASSDRRTLLRSKYLSLLRPVLDTLETTYARTIDRTPQTEYERYFQEKYAASLRVAITSLRSGTEAGSAAASLSKLYKSVNAIYTRGNLRMENISPILASLSDTNIPVPGSEGEHVCISGVGSRVEILPSKTKPKKLFFLGSDGKRYTFLLKSREDLHLDERVMQFLRMANLILPDGLRARHYPVIPLGGRAGLIRWVHGAPPIYALYRKHAKRQAELKELNSGSHKDSANNNKKSRAFRPVDMFFSKLMPALHASGVNSASRSDWPQKVLRDVTKELMSEAPRQLLYKELWYQSQDVREWNRKVDRFSESTAVMSMIGYIIGLGDRHLDNILVDYSSAEVVHIDYNVCFDKGLRLKVPEVVPFRMTPVLQSALGFSGLEGHFRTASERCLGVLRKYKDTLLMLLEAFVYDPLVDWTTARENTQIHGNLEFKVSLSLFASRVNDLEDNLTRVFNQTENILYQIQHKTQEVSRVYNENKHALSSAFTSSDTRSKLENSLKSIQHTSHELWQYLRKQEFQLNYYESEVRNKISWLEQEAHRLIQIQEMERSTADMLCGGKWRQLTIYVEPDSMIFGQSGLGGLAKLRGNEWHDMEHYLHHALQDRENHLSQVISQLNRISRLMGSQPAFLMNSPYPSLSNMISAALEHSHDPDTLDQISRQTQTHSVRKEKQEELLSLQTYQNQLSQKASELESAKSTGSENAEHHVERLREQCINELSLATQNSDSPLNVFTQVAIHSLRFVHSKTFSSSQLSEDWNEFLNMTRCHSWLFCSAEILRQVNSSDSKSLSDQIQNAYSMLRSVATTSSQIIFSFATLIVPETIKALKASPSPTLSRFRTLLSIVETEPVDNTDPREYNDAIDVNRWGTSTSGVVILAGIDALIEKIHHDLPRYDQNDDRLLFKIKIKAMYFIITAVLEAYTEEDKSKRNIGVLRNRMMKSFQNYFHLLTENYLWPRLRSSLEHHITEMTKNLNGENSQDAIEENMDHILEAMDDASQAQEDLDRINWNRFIAQVQHKHVQETIEDVQESMHAIGWQYQLDSCGEREWRQDIMRNLRNNVEQLDSSTKKLQQVYETKFVPVSDVGLQQLSWLFSISHNAQYQEMQTTIKTRSTTLANALQSDQELIAMSRSLIDVVTFRESGAASKKEKLFQYLSSLATATRQLFKARTDVQDYQENVSEAEETRQELEEKLYMLQNSTSTTDQHPQHAYEMYEESLSELSPLTDSLRSMQNEYTQLISDLESMTKSVLKVLTKFSLKKYELTVKELLSLLQDHKHFVEDNFQTILEMKTQVHYPLKTIDVQPILDRCISVHEQLFSKLKEMSHLSDSAMSSSPYGTSQESQSSTQGEQDTAPEDDIQSSSTSHQNTNEKKEVTGRNVTALEVLKRVRLRLEGRDYGHINKPQSVKTQVKNAIHNATSLDNLSQMYEGWSAWL